MIYTINYILVEHPVCQQGKTIRFHFFIVKSPSQLHKDSIKILEYDTNAVKPSLRLRIFNRIIIGGLKISIYIFFYLVK